MSSGIHLAQVQWQPRILHYKERCRVTLDLRLRMFTLYILLGIFPKWTQKSLRSKSCYSRCFTFVLKKSLKSFIWLQNYKQNSVDVSEDSAESNMP
jgi:hypothetical protein